MLKIGTLGGLDIRRDGQPVTELATRKVAALLVYLACTRRPLPREVLAEMFWAEQAPGRALGNLRVALSSLRKHLGDYLLITRDTAALDPEAEVRLDTTELEEMIQAGRIEEAAALYRGDFLEGFYVRGCPAFEDWATIERERLRRLVLEALRDRVAQCLAMSDYRAGIGYATRLLELDPFLEEAHRQLMRLLAYDGQRAAALAQYETCRQILADELGVAPEEETVRLYEQIRAGELKAPTAIPVRETTSVSWRPAFLEEDREGTPLPRFVAREGELARLGRFLDAALAGQGQVAFVIGGPGRGKTALLVEFARRAMANHPDLLVASGNCNAYSGLGDAYLPFHEVMAMLTGDVDAAWAAGAISSDHARRLWLALPLAIRALLDHGPHVTPALVSGPGLLSRAAAAAPGGAPWLTRLEEQIAGQAVVVEGVEQSHLFQQVTNVLRALAQAHPLLLILDDLQWIDAASAGLLFHLGRQLAQGGSRILIAGAYRPEEIALGRNGARHPLDKVLAEFKRQYGDVRLDLGQVGEAEGRRFVNAFLDSEKNCLDEAFRQALYERTGGYPLFTVELLRAIEDRSDLVQDETGCWTAGPSLDWGTLPARVEAVIEERIDRLDHDLRDALTIASVEGETFTAQVVARVQEVPDRQMLRALSRDLEDRHRLVREQGTVALDGRLLARYRFAHTLFQQYLYDDLNEVERRLLHGEIGVALEGFYGDRAAEIAVQLAHHFGQAGDGEREQVYACLAAERAMERLAYAEAVGYLGRVLALTPEEDLAERYRLLLARQKAYSELGDPQGEAQDLEALEALAPALGEAHQAEVSLRRAHMMLRTGDAAKGAEAARAAVDWARRAGHVVHEIDGLLWMAHRNVLLSDYAAARTEAEQALALARQAGLRDKEAHSLAALGESFFFFGDLEMAQRHQEEALSRFRELGSGAGELVAMNHLSGTYGAQGKYAQSGELCRQVLRQARQTGSREYEVRALNNQGMNCWAIGDYAGARDCFEQSLQVSREMGWQRLIYNELGNLGKALLGLDAYDTALAYMQQAEAIDRELGFPYGYGMNLNFLGHVLAALGRSEEAAEAYRKAVVVLCEGNMDHLAMAGRAGLADLALDRGDLAQALEQIKEILNYLADVDNFTDETELGRLYWTCYRVLRANQDARADQILETGYHHLQAQAILIGDDEMMRSFLGRVPAHRALVEAYEGLQR